MSKSVGVLLLNVSAAMYLFATGILGFNNNGELSDAVKALGLDGDFGKVITIILAIVSIAAGVCILLKLFRIPIPIIEMLLIILTITWIVFIVMIDIVYPINKGKFDLEWLLRFSSHLMVLGGITLATERFGGR